MRLPRLTTPLLALSTLHAAALAQTVEFVAVTKLELNEQTSATQVGPIPADQNPYGIDLNVTGDNIGALAQAPTVSGPISNPEPGHNGGVLGFNVNDGYWRYGFPNFDDWGAPTKAEIDTFFGSGVYTFDVAGVLVPLNLTGELYPAAPPVCTLTGGTWSGGVYVIESHQDLTITTSAFTEFGTHVEDAIWMELSGAGFEDEAIAFASSGAPNSLSLVVPANSLTPGATYVVDAGFAALSDIDTAVSGLPGAWAVAAYERSTGLTIQVADDDQIGTTYCDPAVLNSTGLPAEIVAVGSTLVADDDVTLITTQLPPKQFGYFLTSQTQGFVAGPGGSQGNLCLGGNIGRYSKFAAGSGASGILVLELDLQDMPTPGKSTVVAGETWHFTTWYRDVNPTPTSNFSNAVSVVFQ